MEQPNFVLSLDEEPPGNLNAAEYELCGKLEDLINVDVEVNSDMPGTTVFCHLCQNRHLRRFDGFVYGDFLIKEIEILEKTYSYSSTKWTVLFAEHIPPLGQIVENIPCSLESKFLHNFSWKYKNDDFNRCNYRSTCGLDKVCLRKRGILPIFIHGKRVTKWPENCNARMYFNTEDSDIYVAWIHKKDLTFYKVKGSELTYDSSKKCFNFDKEYDNLPGFMEMYGCKFTKITHPYFQPKLRNVIDISRLYNDPKKCHN